MKQNSITGMYGGILIFAILLAAMTATWAALSRYPLAQNSYAVTSQEQR